MHCYAERQAGRFSGPGQPYADLVRKTSQGFRWTGQVRFIAKDLAVPLRWKQPRRIFVNSMSDLFHEDVLDTWLLAILTICAFTPQHTYQILTKRPERMADLFEQLITPRNYWDLAQVDDFFCQANIPERWREQEPLRMAWPLSNIWLGCSVENQATADARIPWLLQTPAAMRFVSYEPALDAIDFHHIADPAHPGLTFDALSCKGGLAWQEGVGLDWVIVGGESGPGARAFDLAWARQLVQQCHAANVACFVKQLGARPYDTDRVSHARWIGYEHTDYVKDVTLRLKDRKGANPAEWESALQVQEMPRSYKEATNPATPAQLLARGIDCLRREDPNTRKGRRA